MPAESDARHSPFDFSADRELAPKALRHVLDDVESLVSEASAASATHICSDSAHMIDCLRIRRSAEEDTSAMPCFKL